MLISIIRKKIYRVGMFEYALYMMLLFSGNVLPESKENYLSTENIRYFFRINLIG